MLALMPWPGFFLAFGVLLQPLPMPDVTGTAPKPKAVARNWEVRFADDSSLKFILLDERLTMNTGYGQLEIPFAEVRRIEFGARLSDAELAAFEKGLADVLSNTAIRRQTGKDALIALGPKVVPAIRRALKRSDAESLPYLDQVLEKFAAGPANPKTEARDYDLVSTDESSFAGRVLATNFQIRTVQFGELTLKASDVVALQQIGAAPADGSFELVEATSVSSLLATHRGRTVRIRTTGSNTGSVWGSGPYTGDSDLGTAAVHAGVLKVGQAGIVSVKIVPTPAAFISSTANGIQSTNYGPFAQGAYEVLKR